MNRSTSTAGFMTEAREIASYLSWTGQKRPENILGPVKWCRRCSRTHHSRSSCGLIRVTVTAKSGRLVKRLIHPESVS